MSYRSAPVPGEGMPNGIPFIIGNLFTSAINFFIRNEDGSSKLAGADYYLFFTLLMLVTAVLFVFVARACRERAYIQLEAQPVE